MSYITVKPYGNGYLVVHIDGHHNEVNIAQYTNQQQAIDCAISEAEVRQTFFRKNPDNLEELKQDLENYISRRRKGDG